MVFKIRACDIIDSPNLVAPLPYLNFLRYLKTKFPKYGVLRLLQEAPAYWDALAEQKKRLFERKRILARIARMKRLKRSRKLLQRFTAAYRKLGPKKRLPVRPIYKRKPRTAARARAVRKQISKQRGT